MQTSTNPTPNPTPTPAGQELPQLAARRRAHTLRSKGYTIRAIADLEGVSHGTIQTMIGGQGRGEPSPMPAPANDNKIVRLVANNGGCSTLSGMVPVSLARRAA